MAFEDDEEARQCLVQADVLVVCITVNTGPRIGLETQMFRSRSALGTDTALMAVVPQD